LHLGKSMNVQKVQIYKTSNNDVTTMQLFYGLNKVKYIKMHWSVRRPKNTFCKIHRPILILDIFEKKKNVQNGKTPLQICQKTCFTA